MNNIAKSLIIVAAISGGYYSYVNYKGRPDRDPKFDTAVSDVDLDEAVSVIDIIRVLGVTVDTFVRVDSTVESLPKTANSAGEVFFLLSSELATAYNAVTPPLYKTPIGVLPLADSSLLAYEDKDRNGERDKYEEDAIFLIEVDGENSRITAKSRSGAVNENRIISTRMLTGFLLKSMLNRQSAIGAAAAVPDKGR